MWNNNVFSVPARTPRELNQGGTSTSEVAITSDGTLPVVLPVVKGGTLASINATTWAATGSGAPRSMIRFKVVAAGRVTAAAGNVTIKLYSGTSATLGSDTQIASTGAVAPAGSASWMIEATICWDATGKRFDGWYQAQLKATTVAPTTLVNPVTSIDPAGTTDMGFVVSGQFATGAAANALYLDEFYLIAA